MSQKGTGIQVSGTVQSQEVSASFEIYGEDDLDSEMTCSQFQDIFEGPLWGIFHLQLGKYTLIIRNEGDTLTLDSLEVSGGQTAESTQGQSTTHSSTRSPLLPVTPSPPTGLPSKRTSRAATVTSSDLSSITSILGTSSTRVVRVFTS